MVRIYILKWFGFISDFNLYSNAKNQAGPCCGRWLINLETRPQVDKKNFPFHHSPFPFPPFHQNPYLNRARSNFIQKSIRNPPKPHTLCIW